MQGVLDNIHLSATALIVLAIVAALLVVTILSMAKRIILVTLALAVAGASYYGLGKGIAKIKGGDFYSLPFGYDHPQFQDLALSVFVWALFWTLLVKFLLRKKKG